MEMSSRWLGGGTKAGVSSFVAFADDGPETRSCFRSWSAWLSGLLARREGERGERLTEGFFEEDLDVLAQLVGDWKGAPELAVSGWRDGGFGFGRARWRHLGG